MTKERNVSKEKKNNKTNKQPCVFFKTVRFFLSVAIIIGLGYVLFNYVPFIAKYDHFVIATNSMEPIIDVNDIVIIDTSYTIEDLEVGEIISFYADINADGDDEVVVHYLHSVEEIDGELVIKTIAHGVNRLDNWDLSEDDILGKHVLIIPKIGSFLLFASSTLGKIVLLIDIIIIYLIFELLIDSKNKKKTDNEDNKKDKLETEE